MPDHEHDHGHGHDHADGGYSGPATIVVGDEEVEVQVRLESRHEPFDGRLHWAGRVLAHPRLAELAGSGAEVRVRAAGHVATGRLADPDPWDRYRLTGTGRPPFPLDVADQAP